MKKLKDIRQENYVSHAQRKAVWAARNDEKKKANEAKEAVEEKTLTPAEMKKREEIAKAMERENPGMDMKKKMAIATWQAKKVAEAKDPNEYDKEGDMMKNQLRQICSANEKLMKMVGDDDNLPEWVQNKVTKATDYIRSVRDYLDAEDGDDEEDDEDESMEESVELDEISRDLARRYIRKVADKTNTGELSIKQVMKRRPGVNLAGKKAYPGVAGEPRVRATESVTLDELSKKTLGTYVKKATGSAVGLGAITTAQAMSSKGKADPDDKRQLRNRMTGVSRATDRLTKEEVESLDELSKKTLGSYIKKASTNQIGNTAKVLAGKNDPETERARKRMGQRMSGIAKATDKLTKESVEELDELKKSTLGSYVNRAADDISHIQRDITSTGTQSPDYKNLSRMRRNRKAGIATAVKKLTREEAEQIDELSKKTLGSYVKKAKDDLGNREAEVTRNRYVDPRGVKDPIKHNNELLMKRAIRRDNINKAVDKLTKEEVKSSDKKPEKYTRPDGKVAYRMVAKNQNVISND